MEPLPPARCARPRAGRAELAVLGHGVRRFAALAAALACSGCATGHLVDRARRWERPIAYEQAAVADGRLSVLYIAAETNQFWRRLGTRPRVAAVPLAQFAHAELSVEDVRIERLPDGTPLAGTPVHLHIEPEEAGEPRLFAADREGGALFLHPAVLTREWVEPWVYPLLPFAVVYDAVAVPVLLIFAPAVIIPGD